MFSQALIDQLAAELERAENTRVPLEHFSRRFPDMDIADGYAVSRAWVAAKRAAGQVVRGHKIGLTSRAMQQASQITEPDCGTLLDSMFIGEGSDIAAARFIAPRVEVELAFVLGRRLQGPGVTIFDVLAATDYVVTAVEIIDARIEQFDRDSKAPFPPELGFHKKLKQNAFEAGLICYPMGGTVDGQQGDHVLLAPPFIIDIGHIDEIVGKLDTAIKATLLGL